MRLNKALDNLKYLWISYPPVKVVLELGTIHDRGEGAHDPNRGRIR